MIIFKTKSNNYKNNKLYIIYLRYLLKIIIIFLLIFNFNFLNINCNNNEKCKYESKNIPINFLEYFKNTIKLYRDVKYIKLYI